MEQNQICFYLSPEFLQLDFLSCQHKNLLIFCQNGFVITNFKWIVVIATFKTGLNFYICNFSQTGML